MVIINTNHKNSIFEREDVIWSTLSALQPLKICLKFDSNEDRDWHYTEKKMNSNLTSAYCSTAWITIHNVLKDLAIIS